MKIFSKILFWKQLENIIKKRLPNCCKKVRFPCTWKELFKGSNQKMSGPESFCIHRPTPKWLSNVSREWWGIIYNFCIQNAKAWLKGRPSQILPICTGQLELIMSLEISCIFSRILVQIEYVFCKIALIFFIISIPIYRLLKPISGAQQVILDEVQTHIKQQGLEAISGLKGESVSWF